MKIWKERLGAHLAGYILESPLHNNPSLLSRIINFFQESPLPIWVPCAGSYSSFLKTCEENSIVCGVGDIYVEGFETSEIKKMKYESAIDLAKKTGYAVLTVRFNNSGSIKKFLQWFSKVEDDIELISIKQLQLTPKLIPDIFEKNDKS